MRPFLEGWVGNPSAPHALGEEARDSLGAARAKVGRLVGGRAEGVLFTSGATEANNLAIKGVALRGRGRHLVTSSIEHASVLVPCRDLIKGGFAVSFLPVDGEGRVDPDDLRSSLRPDTCLVSVGAANGEVGAVQPWRTLAQVAREAGDDQSRELFSFLLKDEEAHVDWLEAQLHQIKEMGYERYLSNQTAGPKD